MSKIPFVSGVDMSAEYNAALCLACRFSCADYIVSLSFREKTDRETFYKAETQKIVNMIARDVSTTETAENAVDALGNTSK